jgi:hypothetical protein
MDVISSAAIFNDHCVVREVVAKPGLCAMLAVCIVSGEIKVAAVNVYSRFGSDMTLVLLVREVLLQSVGKGGKLIVAGQMDYNHRELITVEHTRKAKMKVYRNELQENIDDATNQVEDPELRSEQVIIRRISRINPILQDRQELLQVMEKDPSQRVKFPPKVMEALKPKARKKAKATKVSNQARSKPTIGKQRQRKDTSAPSKISSKRSKTDEDLNVISHAETSSSRSDNVDLKTPTICNSATNLSQHVAMEAASKQERAKPTIGERRQREETIDSSNVSSKRSKTDLKELQLEMQLFPEQFPVCRFFLKGCCCYGPSCRFRHEPVMRHEPDGGSNHLNRPAAGYNSNQQPQPCNQQPHPLRDLSNVNTESSGSSKLREIRIALWKKSILSM